MTRVTKCVQFARLVKDGQADKRTNCHEDSYKRIFCCKFSLRKRKKIGDKLQFRISFSRGSSVGIATDYGLDGPGSNPGGDENFPPLQTGPGAHPVSCTMGTGSFPGVEAAGAWG